MRQTTEIPKIFHRIWFGPPMPPLFEEFGETWAKLHPDWEMRLWNEGNLFPLANWDLFDNAGTISPGFEGQLRSDIARYEILAKYGGVYIDVDFECYKPIDELLEGVECFLAWEIQGQVANNAIMGAVPDHPFLWDLVLSLPRRCRDGASVRPSQLTGPRCVTERLRKWTGREVKMLPEAWFYRIGCKELDRLSEPVHPNEYARHYWNNQHRMRKKTICR